MFRHDKFYKTQEIAMRSLWLASAAIVLSAGMACAQSAPPGDQNVASTAPPMGAMPMQHSMISHGPLPQDASVQTYLRIAEVAIHGRNKAKADDALSHAETLVLTRSVPQSAGIPVDHSSRVETIEQARAALASGDFGQAAHLTRQAMMPTES
ncbi:MAG: hypothetical protein B7Y73_01655 [Acidocella sp. 35-58-6]|nr:MAG: hypothetical protein B7Y73_01655 [Acidocella sp. 35-58-6]